MTGALSHHYAEALAESVFKPGSGLDARDAVRQLGEAVHLIRDSKDLQLALMSPAVKKDRKIALAGIFAERLGLHRAIRNFIAVAISHRRTGELASMLESFEQIVDERLGWVRADITSAHELSPAQREEIERALGIKTGKFIRAKYSIDPSLIGGVRARVQAKEYDATLLGKLESMRQRLYANA